MNHERIIAAAPVISNWTETEAAKGKMLQKKTSEIIAEIEAGTAIVFFDGGDEPIAYCRALPWNPALVEIGSLVVDPRRRRQGYGTRAALVMIQEAASLFPEAALFCLAENRESARLFEKINGIIIEKDTLPNVVWELCFKPGAECAHNQIFPACPCTAFDLTHLSNNGRK